jgi:hypothetical protein
MDSEWPPPVPIVGSVIKQSFITPTIGYCPFLPIINSQAKQISYQFSLVLQR